ncbi:lipoprotein lipase-like isoform X2 [Cetorhinus maximus]
MVEGGYFVWICIFLSPLTRVSANHPPSHTGPQTEKNFRSVQTKFSLRTALDPEGDSCYLIPGQLETIRQCNFNQTARTFLVIHGWTVTGMFESWIPKLVLALYEREGDSNVIVVDWLTRAHQHYPVAADNTKLVGRDIAHFVEWLEEELNFPSKQVHMLGYSLGAHVAGFAGNYVPYRVGRITGLDPAGPEFEGVEAQHRLSPDDAVFVDALHTFTRGSLGRSIGIKQPVGHVDIYPNGGSFQPGCSLGRVLGNMRSQGVYVYHYQLKMHFFRNINQTETSANFLVSLSGTLNESKGLPVRVADILPNRTYSFLVHTEIDIGELLMVKLKWGESSSLWSSIMGKVTNPWTMWRFWETNEEATNDLEIRKVRVKAGETQKRIVFCAKNSASVKMQSGQEVTFVKCHN